MAFRFLARNRSRPDRPRRRPFVAGVDRLEAKALQSFVVRATAAPAILYPPTDKYVPVVVTGTLIEYTVNLKTKPISIEYGELPGAKSARFRVIDEYHRDEPRGNIELQSLGGGIYNFSFTVYLQAERSEKAIAGRRYYVDIAANDVDKSFAGHYVPVQVPHSLTDRGPGPKLAPPKTTTTTTTATKAAAHKAESTTTKAAEGTSSATKPHVTSTKKSAGSFFSSIF